MEEDDLFLEFIAKGSLTPHLHPKTPEDGEGTELFLNALQSIVYV